MLERKKERKKRRKGPKKLKEEKNKDITITVFITKTTTQTTTNATTTANTIHNHHLHNPLPHLLVEVDLRLQVVLHVDAEVHAALLVEVCHLAESDGVDNVAACPHHVLLLRVGQVVLENEKRRIFLSCVY